MRLLLLLFGLCAMCFSGAAATIEVHVVDFDFTDAAIGGSHFDPTISIGDTVRWIFDEGFHSSTSVAGMAESWDSGAGIAPFVFEHTFSNLGDFAYFCLIHGIDNGDGTAGGMSGIVHVVPTGIPEPSSGLLVLSAVVAGLVVRLRRKQT